ncbi:MAG TPA: LysM peptidoglycan-binding domain-containing protein [Anaerolineae bacterium]|nr:LysM peptidoglycan-binding domain-containing protein [Anaerolineae bacterium]HQK15625.1 LysM peptidoglycan-binding domain-containing protein [Anaerolineae bacterium]
MGKLRQRVLWTSVFLSLITLSMLAYAAHAQNAPTVKIVPAEATLQVGQTIELTVQVENITNLSSANLYITFDPDLLEVVDADPDAPETQIAAGDLLSPDYVPTNKAVDGMITYEVQQGSPHPPVSGSGALARITFRAKASGTSIVMLEDVFLSNANGEGLLSTLQNSTLTIISAGGEGPTATPVPPTPTPTTPPPLPTAQPPASPPSSGYNCVNIQGYHIVQRGETLYAIARAYATDPYAIAACNPTVNPRLIHASNHLAIPYAPWGNVPPGPTAARQFTPQLTPAPIPTPATGCRAWHTVQPRETLTAIGLRYNADLWNIGRANRIYNLHLIHVGQVLCIP